MVELKVITNDITDITDKEQRDKPAAQGVGSKVVINIGPIIKTGPPVVVW